jgi:DNA-binding transcriptional MocR family regulator
MSALPDIQLALRPGIVEFGWGHPAAELLPVDGLAAATAAALAAGPNALAYGAEQGPGRLIAALAAWLERQEGQPVTAERIFVTAGVSSGLDLLCGLLTRPGDTALVEAPAYHLALRIFQDCGLELIPVAADAAGLRPDALGQALETLQASGRSPRFLYTTPTFGNPTGICLAAERRAAIVALTEAANCVVLEDDVYRSLWYDAPPPPPLAAYGRTEGVIRLGSFSKILAPGLRLGWLSASPEIVQRCVLSGVLDSGGGQSHFAAHVAAAFMAQGRLEAHVAQLRAAYQARRDTLLAALAYYLPGDCAWLAPGGGFFVWVRLPEGMDSAAFLPLAEAHGVSFVPGARFAPGGGCSDYFRLAFSLLAPAEMALGAERLGRAINAARVRRPPAA